MITPIGWEKGCLGDKCSLEIGGTPSRNVPDYWDEAKEGGNLWVSIRDLNTRVIVETAEQISDAGVKHSNVKLLGEGTILLSFKLTIGRVGISGRPLYTNEAIAGLRSERISYDYLYYGLQQWDLLQGVDQAIKGATLNKEKLKRITVTYPVEEAEQRSITDVLIMMDRAIDQTSEQIIKQKRLHAGLMQDLLQRGIDRDFSIRSLQRLGFRDTPIGKVPIDWRVMKLSEATSKLITYGIVQPGPHVPDGVPFVQTKDLTKDRLAIDTMDRTTKDIHFAYERSMVREGDILIGIRASVGLVAEVPKELDGANISRGVARLSPAKVVSGRFLYWVLQYNRTQRNIVVEIKGSTYPEITLPALRNIQIPVPGSEEQAIIVTMLDQSMIRIDQLRTQFQKLRSIKCGLMRDLLTGKKRVTVVLGQESQREKLYA